MSRQSLAWTNWIVVDDGVEPTRCTLGQRYVRLPSGLKPAESFANNMETALREHSRLGDSEYVFVIEDDDWYGPNHIASLFIALLNADLAGEPRAPFYNVPYRCHSTCGNNHYAALCATAFRASLIPQILPLMDPNDTELDRRIWEQTRCSKHLQSTRHCVGLKGQGGRPGLCSGHVPIGYTPDPDGRVLRKWIHTDADEVLRMQIPTRFVATAETA
jgi:hypothetical protein